MAVNQSYYFNDLVTGVAYDGFGRKEKDYIPSTVHGRGAYVSDVNGNSGIDGNINSFYSGTSGTPVDGLVSSRSHNYSFTKFEDSPLNRIDFVRDPKGGEIHYEYGTNTSPVTIWSVNAAGTLTKGGDYKTGELYRTKTTDASGKITGEYKDKLGQVILKVAGNGTTTAKTYYVYDDFGLLRYVLSPKATGLMTNTTYTPDSVTVKGLCYYYEYDGRKRMVKK